MKRQWMLFLMITLAALPAAAASITVKSPAAGDNWTITVASPIAWTYKGLPDSTKILLVLFHNGAKLGVIADNLAIGSNGNGSYNWSVGTYTGGPAVAGTGYSIKVRTSDNSVSAFSGAFTIADSSTPPIEIKVLKIEIARKPSAKTITVSRPAAGETWIPLKTYTVKWTWTVPQANTDDQCFWKWKCENGCPVDAWLAPAANPDAGDKVYLFKGYCTPYSSSDKVMITYAGEYSGIVPNLQSGDYVVRVARNDKPAFCGTSQPFAVKSTLSSEAATLVPDATQGQSDLALTDVFFDNAGNIAIKVKNMGDSYQGYLRVQYKFITIGSSNETLKDEKKSIDYFSLQPGEEQKMVLCYWGGFTFSNKGWNGGNPSKGIPSRFIPENSRPFQATVTITPDNDINPNNNWASKRMCMIQDADVGTDGQIRFTFNPKNSIYIAAGTANQVPVEGIQWTADKEFTATLEVFIWNYGCAARSFDCLLFVDDLPGQRVAAGLSLQPGERVQWQQQVKIKVPSRCGDHKLVFIADPKEYGHEPYPNSYQNNFIPVTLKIICGGTITGSG